MRCIYLMLLGLGLMLVGCGQHVTRPIVTGGTPLTTLAAFARSADANLSAPSHGLVGTITDAEDRGHIVHGYYVSLLPGDEATIAHFDTVTQYHAPTRLVSVSNAEVRAVWYPGHKAIVYDDGPYGRTISAISTDGRRGTNLVVAPTGACVSLPTFSGNGLVFAYLELNPGENVIRVFRNDSIILTFRDPTRSLTNPTLSMDGTQLMVQIRGEQGQSLGLIHLDRPNGTQNFDWLPIQGAHEPAFDRTVNDRFVYSGDCAFYRAMLGDSTSPIAIHFGYDSGIVCCGHPTFSPSGQRILVGGWTAGEWFTRWFVLPGEVSGEIDPPWFLLPDFHHPDWQ